jgi:hypothetical protein
MRLALLTVDALALLMLGGMVDLAAAARIELAAVIALNLLLLLRPESLVSRAAQVGATAALTGSVAAVALWCVLALGCGIEYFNPRCDAIVLTLIKMAVILALASLPCGQLVAVVSRM